MALSTNKLNPVSKINSIQDATINNNNVPQYPSKTLDLLTTGVVFITILGTIMRLIHRESFLKTSWNVLNLLSVFFIALSTCHIILRFCNFLTELSRLNNYCKNEITNIKNSTMFFNTQSIIVSILSIIFIIFFCFKVGNPINQAWEFGPIVGFLSLTAVFLLSYMLDLDETKFMNDKIIQAMKGVDYGSGMAFSYYYGYLRFVLPSDGVNAGIRLKMETYEAIENVTITVKKLFILIPESGYIPSDLSEASNCWLESTKSLQSEIRDRAGTKRRNYKNTVYKIHPGGIEQGRRPVYIVVEGATPMLTLFEIIQHYHPQTETYRNNKMQIIASFYHTLKELVDNPNCRDFIELVYYKDYDDDGKFVNIAEILLDRIRKFAPESS